MDKPSRVVLFDAAGNFVKMQYVTNPSAYRKLPNCLIDPAIPRGVPPHRWRLVGGFITHVEVAEVPGQAKAPSPLQNTLDKIHKANLWYRVTELAVVLATCIFLILRGL